MLIRYKYYNNLQNLIMFLKMVIAVLHIVKCLLQNSSEFPLEFLITVLDICYFA